MRLSEDFFLQNTTQVAKQLLGKKIIRKIGNQILSAMIVETEAYLGFEDTACHSYKGKTSRTEVMFDKGGVAYIYMIYGMYFMFNIVTEKINNPCAVLIRAVEPIENIELMMKNRNSNIKNITNGPGKFCQAFQIDKTFNKENLITSDRLWIENYIDIKNISSGKRIGINYAEKKDRDALLRFWIKGNKFVSKS